MPKSLDQLLSDAGLTASAPARVPVQSVTDCSRDAVPGSLFVAVRGTKTDARRFIPDAISRGAVAVVADGIDSMPEPARECLAARAGDVTLVAVPDARRALALLAHAWFDHPARALKVAGVTGTNGKTTVTHYLESIFKAAGLKPGVMGTIEYRSAETRSPALTTTPSPLVIAALLDRIRREGGRAAALEISSHGIDQARVDGLVFDAAIMTNLTRDHIDYHKTMEAYGAVKRRFFFSRAAGEEPRAAIFNADDAFSAGMAAEYRGRRFTYGIDHPADFAAFRIEEGERDSRFVMRTPDGGHCPVRLALPGRYNILNALAAAAAAVAMDIPISVIVQGLETMTVVPGRCQRIDVGQPFTLIVDYAHTPDALSAILSEGRRLCKGRLVAVFGCGGDRDQGKRPIMGAIAGRLCDHVIVTNCNPRSEDPARIAAAIVEGLRETRGDFEIELDRRAAIRRACEMARPGDMIIVAGRGHEPHQLIGGESRPFDDRVVCREILLTLRGGGGTAGCPER